MNRNNYREITISNEKDTAKKRNEESNYVLVDRDILTIVVNKYDKGINTRINLNDVGDNPYISDDYTSQELNKILRYKTHLKQVIQLLDIEENKIKGGSLK